MFCRWQFGSQIPRRFAERLSVIIRVQCNRVENELRVIGRAKLGNMTDELRRALDEAYEVFARYAATDYLNFSPRGLTMQRWEQLNERHDVGVLMYSDGGEMLRLFLPRWLDWLSDDSVGFRSWEWELGSLGYRLSQARWREWPADEAAALWRVFEAWTREEIARHNGAPADASRERQLNVLGEEGKKLGLIGFAVHSDLLWFLAEIGEASFYLELWLDCNLPQLARWLWVEDLRERKVERGWITSSRLEASLEAAFFAAPDGKDAELFSRSVELIRSLRSME